MKVRLGSLISTILVIFCVSVSLSYAIERNSVVGVWFFDEGEGEVAKDSSENGHDGELIGEQLEWVDGKFDGALSFPGVNGNFVSVPDDDSLDLTTFSVTAWIKILGGGGDPRILVKGALAANYSYYFTLRSSTWQLFMGFSTTGRGGWTEAWGTEGRLADDEWHHVAGTYDKKFLRVYVDGEMDAEEAGGGEPFDSKNPVTIGAESDGVLPFNGIIDDVGLFNVGLTENEVKSIMTKGLDEGIGISAVSPAGRLAIAWGSIKAQ